MPPPIPRSATTTATPQPHRWQIVAAAVSVFLWWIPWLYVSKYMGGTGPADDRSGIVFAMVLPLVLVSSGMAVRERRGFRRAQLARERHRAVLSSILLGIGCSWPLAFFFR